MAEVHQFDYVLSRKLLSYLILSFISNFSPFFFPVTKIFSARLQPMKCALLEICRFTSALSGQAVTDIIQRTTGRLESLHSEGVHVWRFVGSYLKDLNHFIIY